MIIISRMIIIVTATLKNKNSFFYTIIRVIQLERIHLKINVWNSTESYDVIIYK